jgi:hypothetical protein
MLKEYIFPPIPVDSKSLPEGTPIPVVIKGVKFRSQVLTLNQMEQVETEKAKMLAEALEQETVFL